jgi:hypothetical protein
MRGRRVGGGLVLAWLLLAGPAAAAQPGYVGYRWVDEQGNVHYAGRRDQVPERYRHQLPSERGPEPGKVQAGGPTPPVTGGRVGPPVSAECVLRVRGTEQRRGSSQSFPDCDACQKALKARGAEEAGRSECVPTSVESYR